MEAEKKVQLSISLALAGLGIASFVLGSVGLGVLLLVGGVAGVAGELRPPSSGSEPTPTERAGVWALVVLGHACVFSAVAVLLVVGVLHAPAMAVLLLGVGGIVTGYLGGRIAQLARVTRLVGGDRRPLVLTSGRLAGLGGWFSPFVVCSVTANRVELFRGSFRRELGAPFDVFEEPIIVDSPESASLRISSHGHDQKIVACPPVELHSVLGQLDARPVPNAPHE